MSTHKIQLPVNPKVGEKQCTQEKKKVSANNGQLCLPLTPRLAHTSRLDQDNTNQTQSTCFKKNKKLFYSLWKIS